MENCVHCSYHQRGPPPGCASSHHLRLHHDWTMATDKPQSPQKLSQDQINDMKVSSLGEVLPFSMAISFSFRTHQRGLTNMYSPKLRLSCLFQALLDDRQKYRSMETSEGSIRRLTSEPDGTRLVVAGDSARASESEAIFNMVGSFFLSHREYDVF